MSAVDPKGTEIYWIDGVPYEGLRFEPSKIGTMKFWMDGLTVVELTPLQNFDTGKMFLIFE